MWLIPKGCKLIARNTIDAAKASRAEDANRICFIRTIHNLSENFEISEKMRHWAVRFGVFF